MRLKLGFPPFSTSYFCTVPLFSKIGAGNSTNGWSTRVEPSKKNTTMVKPFAGSSGVARGNEAKPSRYHLCNRVVESSVEGFFLIM
jgi:hypothetical protein